MQLPVHPEDSFVVASCEQEAPGAAASWNSTAATISALERADQERRLLRRGVRRLHCCSQRITSLYATPRTALPGISQMELAFTKNTASKAAISSTIVKTSTTAAWPS